MNTTALTLDQAAAAIARTAPAAADIPLAAANDGDTIIAIGHRAATDFVHAMLANWQHDRTFAAGAFNDPDEPYYGSGTSLGRHYRQVRHTWAVLAAHAPNALIDDGVPGGCTCGYYAWVALPAAPDTPGAIQLTEFTGDAPAPWPLTGPAPEDESGNCAAETEYRRALERAADATRFTALYADSGRPGSETDFTTGAITKAVKRLRAALDAQPAQQPGLIRALIADLERPAKQRSRRITADALENTIRRGECTGTPEQIQAHLAWIASVRAEDGGAR